MDTALPLARVTGFDHLIPAVALPDPDDRHVVAAAIHAGATHILTFNLKDFPSAALAPHGLVSIHPDLWLRELITRWPEETLGVLSILAQALRAPPMTPTQVTAALRELKVSESADQFDHLLALAL